jgi:FkbM family methyltransferase
MTDLPRPDDFLRRYVLRPDFLRKLKGRVRRYHRFGTRNPLTDLRSLFVTGPAVVFDVGANVGYETAAYHQAWPATRIWAIEPTPATYADLTRNVGSMPGVTCIQAAASDRDGEAEFRVDPATHRGGSNSLLAHTEHFELQAPREGYRTVRVPTMRLDTLCARAGIERISLLKLDVEGAELMALEGARRMLGESRIDAVLAEVRVRAAFEGQPLLQHLLAFMGGLDYVAFAIYPFAETRIGQALFGDVLWLGPRFRGELVERLGAPACGFSR